MRAAATDLASNRAAPLVNPVGEHGGVHHSALWRNRRLQRLEALLADAGDLLELVDRLEAAVLIAVLGDPLRERRPDPVEALELRLRRARQADPRARGARAWNSARCDACGSDAGGPCARGSAPGGGRRGSARAPYACARSAARPEDLLPIQQLCRGVPRGGLRPPPDPARLLNRCRHSSALRQRIQ